MSSNAIGDYAGIIALLLFCLAAMLRASKTLEPKTAVRRQNQKLKDGVAQRSLITLPVVVTDRRGQFVSGLQKDDFRVFEDGRPQPICKVIGQDFPVTVGLILDASESMRTNRNDVTAAAMGFIESTNPRDEIFVVNFNDRASLGLPPNIRFTNNLEELEQAIRVHPLEGETALRDAILLALERVKLGTRQRKSLLVISDGEDNASRVSCEEVVAIAGRNSIPIYALEIADKHQISSNPDLLGQLANITGGTVHIVKCAKEISQMGPQIARELREQYTLVYSSSNSGSDGSFRTVRVVAETAAEAKLIVRTRIGYLV